jgi:hypothetical protein
MKYIAHRGNLLGPNTKLENLPPYIDDAINKSFDVEIDLWLKHNMLFLGHDEPMYMVTEHWLRTRISKLWIHCKNYLALEYCVSELNDANYFFHNVDDYTLTSKGYVWIYPNKPNIKNGICVLPEWSCDINNFIIEQPLVGVCSDYIQLLKR